MIYSNFKQAYLKRIMNIAMDCVFDKRFKSKLLICVEKHSLQSTSLLQMQTNHFPRVICISWRARVRQAGNQRMWITIKYKKWNSFIKNFYVYLVNVSLCSEYICISDVMHAVRGFESGLLGNRRDVIY